MKTIVYVAFLLLTGCSVLTPVRALPESSSAVTLSFGGPYVPSSSPTAVIPYTTLGYAYGYKNGLTLSSNFHVLSTIFKTPGIDVGAVYTVLPQSHNMPEITLYPKLYFFHDFSSMKNFRCFPDIACNLSYQIGKDHLVYTGVDYIMQLTTAQNYYTPFVGYSFPITAAIAGQFELKWMAANADTKHGVFEGQGSLNGRGSVGLFAGVSYGF